MINQDGTLATHYSTMYVCMYCIMQSFDGDKSLTNRSIIDFI